MQNAALREMGLDAVYVAFDVPPRDLPAALFGMPALGIRGANCTIPHKTALVSLTDELTEEAARVGAVNTILFREGRSIGHNTDGEGFLASLRAEGIDPRGLQAVILGTGGSARSVALALQGCGARVVVAGRSLEKAESLALDLNSRLDGVGEPIAAVSMAPEVLAARIAEADLLVNATPVGMHPESHAMPGVPLEAIHGRLFCYDLIYNPAETRLLAEARKRGARTANGAGMLAHQGALSLQMWTGRTAPVEVMERVVRARLAAQGGHADPAPANGRG